MRPSSLVLRRPAVTFILLLLIAQTASGQTTRRKLVEQTVVDGITCGPTGRASAEFHASGRLSECPLASDTTIAAHRFFADTWLRFDDTGLLFAAWLSRDSDLDGHSCRGDGYKAYTVEFHPNGRLKLCYFRVDTVIEGIPCIHGSFWTEVRGGGRSKVWFSTDGALARCQVARAFTANGQSYARWDTYTAPIRP